MKAISKIVPAAAGVLAILIVSYSQPARAGWSVNVGVTGSGTVTVKVTSATGATNGVKTQFTRFPSAAINQQSNFTFTATRELPAGADSGTYVQVRATNNYRTFIESRTVGGDLNDNDELLQFVIPKSACAEASVEVEPILITPNSVTFHYRAKLSDEGSAVLLRVIDAVTGQQRYLVLLTGPLDNTDPCEGTFTVVGDPAMLDLLVDGHSSTLPFNIACPDDMVLGYCSAAVADTYDPPAVVTGDTGPYTVTYAPLPYQLVLGVTNTVTATATDTNGCIVSCQFNVYREPISFDGFFSPVGGVGGTCEMPLRTFKLGRVAPLKFKMTCGGLPVIGLPIITIRSCADDVLVFEGPFQSVNDEWHFNIDSSVLNNPGNYTIIATLPDGSQHSVVVAFRK